MRASRLSLLLLLLLIPLARSAEGRTIRVPGDYAYVCDATAVAGYGDTVLVAPGHYGYPSADCVEIRDGVVLTSEQGPAVTRLFAWNYGADLGGLIRFDEGGGPATEISGFTIECADIGEQGSVFNAINCRSASPQVRNNVIRAAEGYPHAFVGASAIAMWPGTSPTIVNNTIIGPACGVCAAAGGVPVIARNIIAHSQTYGFGILCDPGATPEITCNEFWDVPQPIVECPSGEGNFVEDPLFCDPDQYDFSLRSDSPAVHGYGCGLVGALPVGCEPEAIEPTRWGFVKALYR